MSYTIRTALSTLMLALAASSQAAPVSVDGVIGAEWAGTAPVVVAHDASAPSGNFSTPTSGTNAVGYSVYLRSDAQYMYVALQANGDTQGLNFANLYFNTDLVGGSDFGIEVTNNRAFQPGVAGYFDLSAYMTYALSGSDVNKVIEMALSWDYFTTNPNHILPAGTNVANGIQLRTSQSFGYTATGGAMNADFSGSRFGTVAQAVDGTELPEPSSAALGLLALGALAALRRKGKRTV